MLRAAVGYAAVARALPLTLFRCFQLLAAIDHVFLRAAWCRRGCAVSPVTQKNLPVPHSPKPPSLPIDVAFPPWQVPTSTWSSSRRGCLAWLGAVCGSAPIGCCLSALSVVPVPAVVFWQVLSCLLLPFPVLPCVCCLLFRPGLSCGWWCVVSSRLWLCCLVLSCVVLCFWWSWLSSPLLSLFAAAPCQMPTSTWRSSRRGGLAWFGGMGQSGPVGFSVCFLLLVPSGCCFFFCLFSSCSCDAPAAMTAYVSPNSKGLSGHMLLQPRDHPLQPPESRLTKTSCCEELALWKLAPAVIDTMKQP